jgi:hypothetical protein
MKVVPMAHDDGLAPALMMRQRLPPIGAVGSSAGQAGPSGRGGGGSEASQGDLHSNVGGGGGGGSGSSHVHDSHGGTGSSTSGHEDEQIATLRAMLARGEITATQFEDTVVHVAQAREGTQSGMGAREISKGRRFDAARPWLLKSFMMPEERKRVEQLLGDTGTVDAFCAMRYLRANGGDVGRAAAQLRASLAWRRLVMEPLLANPAPIASHLAKGRFWLLPNTTRAGHPIVMSNMRLMERGQYAPEAMEAVVLSMLFVIEKAIQCSDDPLCEVVVLANRVGCGGSSAGRRGAARGLDSAWNRPRMLLLDSLLEAHYPKRIHSVLITPALGPVASMLLHVLPLKLKVDVPVASGSVAQLDAACGVDGSAVPIEAGGTLSYRFTLADVVLPTFRFENRDASLAKLRFADGALEVEYQRSVGDLLAWHRARAPLLPCFLSLCATMLRRDAAGDPAASGGAAPGPRCELWADLWLPLVVWLALLAFAHRLLGRRTLRQASYSPRLAGRAVRAMAGVLMLPSFYRIVDLNGGGGGGGGGGGCSGGNALAAQQEELFRFVLVMFTATYCYELRPLPFLQAVGLAWCVWLGASVAVHMRSGDGDDVEGVAVYWHYHLMAVPALAAMGLLMVDHEARARERFSEGQRTRVALSGAQEEVAVLRAQTANTPMLGVDASLRVTLWNTALAELTAWPTHAAVGRSLLDLVHPSTAKHVRARLDPEQVTN